MYSLTFCVRFLLPERHHWKPAVQAAAVMLRTSPVTRQSPASSARRPRPAGRLHYVVISWGGRGQACNYGSRYIAIARQPLANPPNSAQLRDSLYHAPKLHPGPCSSVGVRPRTDRHTDRQTHTRVTTIHFASSTTHAKCNHNSLRNLVLLRPTWHHTFTLVGMT